jgi:hypothetical protein
MSELDDAMREHMDYIVLHENKPFSFKDFLCFEEDGKEYRMRHGTIRNKLLAFRKKGIIEPDYNSGIAFYTLAGIRFGRPMTPNHTGVTISHNDPVYNMIKNLPMDKQSIHDIHLKFKAPNIYKTFSVRDFPKFKANKAIGITSWSKNNTIVKITINKNDTVTVIIGCSLDPIPLDYNGFIRFFRIIGMSEGFLEGLSVTVNNDKLIQNQSIPQSGQWIVTRWDFGRDSSVTYKGEKFEITVMNALHIFERIYAKDFKKYKKIRLEDVECPRKTAIDAIQEKLNS